MNLPGDETIYLAEVRGVHVGLTQRENGRNIYRVWNTPEVSNGWLYTYRGGAADSFARKCIYDPYISEDQEAAIIEFIQAHYNLHQ